MSNRGNEPILATACEPDPPLKCLAEEIDDFDDFDEEYPELADSRLWSSSGYGNYYGCNTTVDKLPPGQYTLQHDGMQIYFSEVETNFDELLQLPDSISERIINEIDEFWKMEDSFRKYGYIWKRGVMLYGPPGSGKTSTLQLVANNIIEHGGVCLYMNNPSIGKEGLQLLRKIEPRRPLLVIIEDIDSVIENNGEDNLLAVLDGEAQIDNVVFIATTNYPERLNPRFMNRPSRFDIVELVGMPNLESRKMYIQHRLSLSGEELSDEELDRWSMLSKGYSVAHIKELVISVKVFGMTIEDSTARVNKLMKETPNLEDYKYEDD